MTKGARLLVVPAVMVIAMAFTGCDGGSGVRAHTNFRLAYDYWNTPNPAWRFTPSTPHRRCNANRTVYVVTRGGVQYFSSYYERSVDPAMSEIRVVNWDSFVVLGGYAGYGDQNGWSIQANVKGCDTSKIGYGWIMLNRSKVHRSMTFRCTPNCVYSYGPWAPGWETED